MATSWIPFTPTTEANRRLSPIQPRMPVIIEKADWPVWLGEVEGDVAALLRPAPASVLRLWLADKRVGNEKNNGPELLEQHGVETERPALLYHIRRVLNGKASVAQPDRATGFEPVGWGFKSLRARQLSSRPAALPAAALPAEVLAMPPLARS
jgi:hypothetical protein